MVDGWSKPWATVFLVEFQSAEAALRAALNIQKACAAAAEELPKDRRIYLRIGAHLGDVVVDEEDILGDGVNLAARLEQLARPGGIAASATFARALDADLAAKMTDDGTHRVKNIQRPVRVWRWDLEGVDAEPVADLAASRTPTVAVLPFVNRSTDPEQSFFAEGLAEDITSALQQMGRLPVVSAASSLTLDAGLNIADASRILGAQYLVKGAVRRSHARVRVTVELVECETGHSLWSEKYDRPFEDIFEIQDDITLCVVTALDSELVEGEINRVHQIRPDHLGAWEHYICGMSHMRKPGVEDLRNAQREFLAAIDVEPQYGEAWAALAWAYLKEYGFGASERSKAVLDLGFEAAKKGLAFSDKSPFAHHSMSTAYVWRGEQELSLKELEHAIRLNPYFTRAKIAYHNRKELSDPSVGLKAAEDIREALTLSPREPDRWFYFWAIARINLIAGELDEALDWAERAVTGRPTDPNIFYRYAICLAALDRVDEAQEALNTCEELSPGIVKRLRDWRPYEDNARNEKLFDGFRRHRLAGWD